MGEDDVSRVLGEGVGRMLMLFVPVGRTRLGISRTRDVALSQRVGRSFLAKSVI